VIHAQTQLQGPAEIGRRCRLAGLSRAGYYRHWRASAPRQEETALRDEIQRLSLAERFYGYRRLTVLLQRAGLEVNHKRVARIRREDNLLCVPKKAFRPATTDSRHRFMVHPNLARWMVPLAVNQLWVADITYVRLSEEFVYLAVILDAFSRRAIGWSLATHLQASLALAALEMALGTRAVSPGLVHHSDRGVQGGFKWSSQQEVC
jgi:transposase InsO family protein